MKLRSDYVYEYRPTVEEEEKELVAMAVDAAKNVLRSAQSSYNVAAVTPGVGVDHLMPDAYKEEESLEPQRDDDICSTTSTIEYTYPEEEEPSKNSYGDDEDDKEDEEDSEEDEDDDEEDEDDDNSSMFSDADYGMIPEEKSLTDEDSESDSDNGNVSKSPVKQLSKDDWVASWNEGDPQEHLTWINVYAYYRKKEKGLGGYGGYGVILRYDDSAKPVTASAKYSADGKSFLYQVLMGIKAGVKLAEDHNLPGSVRLILIGLWVAIGGCGLLSRILKAKKN
ncbi:mitotic apparatus protein p62-like [Papaver somniferum]|uniref:mitotic apparatus protein p62-like n=1 Tax=Papaver somniferum TaxID=3469 RepID=UPI000E6F513D|nr:mitotic apparatus protein p62-like [Papaver somniferum]XP_026454639.1 mitotic apparatus protein p62-like [Papaver somniferum]